MRAGTWSFLDLNSEMITCPDCQEELPDEARRCRACGRWLRDCKPCPQCAETVLALARLCRFCGYDFVADPLGRPRAAELAGLLPHTLTATPLGGMICESSITALFLPPRLNISEEEIVVTKWSWLGLRSYQQKVALAKVASVRLLSGVIWAGLVVETFGGSIADLAVNGLDKAEARQTVQVLEKIAPSRKSPPPLP